MKFLTCVWCIVWCVTALSFVRCKEQDSYLSALKKSHDIDTLPADRSDYNSYPDSSATVSTSNSDYDFYHPKPQYGPPGYESPKPIYGPPPSGPPAGSPVYHGPSGPHGPSAPSYSGPIYGHTSIQFNPYSAPSESWLDKLKMKFNMFTLAKILLKLILFKKVVKFLAVLCLLLFLPKLQDKNDTMATNDEEERQLDAKNQINVRINEISDFAMTAFDAFNKKNGGCPDVSCRLTKMMDTIDDQYPIKKVLNLYVPQSHTGNN